MTRGATRYLLIAAGAACVGLAAIGIVLPLLPTTPFLLLAALCFAKSSQRLHTWLYNHRWFGTYLANYESGRITRRHRVTTLIILWCGLTLSAVMIGKPIMYAVLGIVGVGVTIHLLRLRSTP